MSLYSLWMENCRVLSLMYPISKHPVVLGLSVSSGGIKANVLRVLWANFHKLIINISRTMAHAVKVKFHSNVKRLATLIKKERDLTEHN